MTRVNVKRRVAAAFEGARTAGLDVARIEVDKDGRVVIIAWTTESADVNALDAWGRRAKSPACHHCAVPR
jgi:hypothetical protein